MKASVVGFLLAACGSVYASGVTSVDFVTQSTILTTEGNLSACGIRFLATKIYANENEMEIVDGSFMFSDRGYYTVKAGHFTVNQKTKNWTPKSGGIAWLRIGQAQLNPVSQPLDGETPGYKLFVAKIDDDAAAIKGFYSRERLWVAFSGKSGLTNVYAGKLTISDETMEQFRDCMSSVIDRMQKEMAREDSSRKK